MERVVLDAETRSKFNGLNRRLELTDETGNLIGYYLPPNVYRDILGSEAVGVEFSEEELRTLMADKDPGRPLTDILSDLRRQWP